MILAGDVGGTKTHLALFREVGAALAKERESVTATRDHASLEDAVRSFLAVSPSSLTGAAFGIAGPVHRGRVLGANLPWEVTSEGLARALGGDGTVVRLLNDLEASALALADLGDEELVYLQRGEPPGEGARALLSPGTGLGLAIVPEDGAPLASEGGHADFSARTDEEIDLLRYLRERFGRASVERVVSGPGIVNVFCWLRDRGVVPDDSGIEAEPGDSMPAAAITDGAETSRICAETVRVWYDAFGAEAGNLALRAVARGGVFLGGGIPSRLAPQLERSGFLAAFRAKPPHEALVRAIPVAVVLDRELALRGAARAAASIARVRLPR